MRKFLCVMLMGAALPSAWAQQPAPKEADVCLSDKTPAEKIVPCTRAIEGAQGANKVLFLLARGRSYAQQQQYEAAEADFSQGLQLVPGHPQALYERGSLHAFLKRYEQAVTDFTLLLEKHPKEPDGRYNRAFVFSEMGRDQEAIRDLTLLLESHPEDVQAFNDRGGLHLRNGQLKRAIADYDAAIKFSDDFNEAIYNRGRAYLLAGVKEKAVQDFRRVLKLRRNNPYAALRLALSGDDSAIGPALQALDKDRWPAPLLQYFSGTLSAEEVLAVAANLSKDAPDGMAEAGYYLGSRAWEKGDKQAALNYFARAEASHARSVIEYYDAIYLRGRLSEKTH